MLSEIFHSRVQCDLEFAELLDGKPFAPRLEEADEADSAFTPKKESDIGWLF
jgi:hypothetical protein